MGFFETIIVAIVSCCSPAATKPDEEPVRTPAKVRPPIKEAVEMESITKKEDDRPTTSTGGIPDNELAIVSLKTQREPSVVEEEKRVEPVRAETPPPPPEKASAESESSPQVVLPRKDSEEEIEQSYIDTEIRRRSTHEQTDYESASAERHLRDSVQIQAPFPSDDESDAFVVSPTPPQSPSTSVAPQISIQSTSESEESSEVDEVPRPFSTFDDGQPKALLPMY
jgi:hypothetical protein